MNKDGEEFDRQCYMYSEEEEGWGRFEKVYICWHNFDVLHVSLNWRVAKDRKRVLPDISKTHTFATNCPSDIENRYVCNRAVKGSFAHALLRGNNTVFSELHHIIRAMSSASTDGNMTLTDSFRVPSQMWGRQTLSFVIFEINIIILQMDWVCDDAWIAPFTQAG